MAMLMFVLQLFIGMVFHYLMKARKYIVGREFCYKKWLDENLVPFIWGSSIIVIVCLIILVGGDSIFDVVKFFGLNIEGISQVGTEGGQGAGILLGGAIGEYVRTSLKPKRETSNNEESLDESIDK